MCSELLKEALLELIFIFQLGLVCFLLIQPICSVVRYVHKLWEIKELLSECSADINRSQWTKGIKF